MPKMRRVYVNDEEYRKIMLFGRVNYTKNANGQLTFAAAIKGLIKELDKPVWELLFH